MLMDHNFMSKMKNIMTELSLVGKWKLYVKNSMHTNMRLLEGFYWSILIKANFSTGIYRTIVRKFWKKLILCRQTSKTL